MASSFILYSLLVFVAIASFVSNVQIQENLKSQPWHQREEVWQCYEKRKSQIGWYVITSMLIPWQESANFKFDPYP